jgi:hypothetical protein
MYNDVRLYASFESWTMDRRICIYKLLSHVEPLLISMVNSWLPLFKTYLCSPIQCQWLIHEEITLKLLSEPLKLFQNPTLADWQIIQFSTVKYQPKFCERYIWLHQQCHLLIAFTAIQLWTSQLKSETGFKIVIKKVDKENGPSFDP